MLQEESFQQFLQRPENRALVEAQQRKEVLQAVKAKEKASALDFRSKVTQRSSLLPLLLQGLHYAGLSGHYSQVLTADLEAQKALVPFLKNSVLRRIIQTFTNDAQGDVSKWACNPEVIRLLTEAKRLMDEGYVTETEMEAKLVAQLEVRISPPICSTAAFTAVMLNLAAMRLIDNKQDHHHHKAAEAEHARLWLRTLPTVQLDECSPVPAQQMVTLDMENLVSALNEHVSL